MIDFTITNRLVDKKRWVFGDVKDGRQPHARWVYVLSDGTACKIGIANQVQRRIRGLQIGNPRKITVVGAWLVKTFDHALYVEKTVLYACRRHRLRGEWLSGHPIAIATMVKWIIQNPERAMKPKALHGSMVDVSVEQIRLSIVSSRKGNQILGEWKSAA